MIAERQSNYELLRIVSIFMILVMHANFLGIGVPTPHECDTHVASSLLRFMTQSFCIVAVNVFILISGWFGIRPKENKFLCLLFQVLFFSIGTLLVYSAIIGKHITINQLLKSVLITKGYWFIKSYLCLYILSPVLNSFIEHSTKTSQKFLLISFFVFQTIYGWSDSAPEFGYGYSVVSFIWFYLLGAYLRRYKLSAIMSNKFNALALYVLPSLITAVLAFIVMKQQIYLEHSVSLLFSYISPLVVISSIGVFSFFSQLKLCSKIINWAASSCLSVYVIHTGVLWPFFLHIVNLLHQNYHGVHSVMLIVGFLLLVFALTVLLDQIRKALWQKTVRIYKWCIARKEDKLLVDNR